MPGPQSHAIQCPLPDMFYGGARGGGKSDFLLGDFASRAARYGANLQGVLFRRTMDELTDLIERARRIYGALGWKYNETLHTWRATNGAVLFMRYLDVDADAEHYKSWNNQWLGFDQLEQWPSPTPVDKLWATLRSSCGIPCVRRTTGNPGGPGAAWIKKRYQPHLWRSGEPYRHIRYQPQPDAAPHLWIDSVFIPARIEDNPLLASEYEANLAASANSPQLFKAWRYGDWAIIAGAYFDIFDPAIHVVPAASVQPWDPRWISMDWGFTDDSAIHWHASNEEKRVVTYQELVKSRRTPQELGALIAERCVPQFGGGFDCPDERCGGRHDEYQDFILSPDAFGTKQSERTIADELGDVMERHGLPRPRPAISGPKTRVPGWQLMYQLLTPDASGRPWWTITRDCPDLIESIPLLLHGDPPDQEDCAPHPRDHSPDSARMGLTTFLRRVEEPRQVKVVKMVHADDAPDMHAVALRSMRAEAKLGGERQRPVARARNRYF